MSLVAAFRRVPIYCGVWKRMAPVRHGKHLRKLIRSYLDETTKTRPEGWGMLDASASKEARMTAVGAGLIPLAPGKDYTPFASGIWVFGHLAAELSVRGVRCYSAQPAEVVECLADWWSEDRNENEVQAQHVVASFAPSIASELHRLGYPVDSMLLSVVHSTLSQYQSRFYPDDPIGYIAGCHHDRATPHVHLLVHPETSSGRTLRFTSLKEGEIGEDKFAYLLNTFNSRTRQLFVGLSQGAPLTPEQIESMRTQRLLLTREAMLQVGPDSIDAEYAAAAKLEAILAGAGYQEILVKASDGAMSDYLHTPASLLDPAKIGARWDAITAGWDKKRKGLTEAGMAAFSAMAGHREDPQGYLPVMSPGLIPTTALTVDYAALASRGRPLAVRNLSEALKARRAADDRTRAMVNILLKEYRAKVEQGRRDLDALLAQFGFGAAVIEMMAGASFGTQPSYAGIVSEGGQTLARGVAGRTRSESLAEREMASIATKESAMHQPTNPEDRPSVLATPHVPRFRHLGVPSILLDGQTNSLE